MGIVSKLFGDDAANGRNKASTGHDRDYIDLSDYSATEKTGAEAAASTYVKFAQVRALDDLKHLASYVYDGNILVLDIKGVQQDEILLRRLSNELRKLAADTGGDIAGLGESHIMLTPTGIKVDRRQITVSKEESAETTRRPATSTTPAVAATPAPRAAPAPRAPPPAIPVVEPTGAPQRTNGRRPNGAQR